MLEVKRKENESASAMMYRFTKKVQQSGILRESKKRRFYARGTSRLKRRLSALYRSEKTSEMARQKKLGTI